jgi:2-oxo-4-hydroxy-4-carboxy-5-ureidoimidazoline decarboxylase
MADPAQALNALSEPDARAALTRCCGAQAWVAALLAGRPYASAYALFQRAEQAWFALDEAEMLEAFAHHPRIGENLALLRARYAAEGKARDAAAFSAEEQAGVAQAGEATLLALRDKNLAYEARFGFIFLVFASGKSAAEMLALLEQRLGHDRATELAIARREHAKITALRLSRLAP